MSWVRALAWAVTAVSVAFAARYGIALGATGVEAVALGATFAILDLFKCQLPQLTRVAMARGRSFLAIAGRVGFGGLSLLNVWGTMSVEILERAAVAANQTSAAQELADLEAQRARVQDRLRVLGETRPVGTVEAAMKAERHDRRWTTSKGCTAATRDSRDYCAAYARLFGELAAAPEAEKQRARLDELQGQITRMRAAQTPNAPELQLVAKLFGVDLEAAGFIRAVVFAAVVEIVCGFALTLVSVNRPGSRGCRRRQGARHRWLARWTSNARGSARSTLTSTPPPATCEALDSAREGEVSSSAAPSQAGSAIDADGAGASSLTSPSGPSLRPRNESARLKQTTTPPATCQPLDGRRQGEASLSPTPPEIGLATEANGATASPVTSPSGPCLGPMNEPDSAREGAQCSTARQSPLAPHISLESSRSPLVGIGLDGRCAIADEGASLASAARPSFEPATEPPAREERVLLSCPCRRAAGVAACPAVARRTPPSPGRPARQSDAATSQVRAFVGECVRSTVGRELAAAKLMALYDSWCAHRGACKFDWQIVARELRRLGFARRKTRGLIIYCDLAAAG